MKVQQISLFMENRAGRLAEISRLLADAEINIRALSLADTSDFGILRLIVDKTEHAYRLLKGAGYTTSRTDVVAVEVPDRPGGLAEVLTTLEKGVINVEYMYAFVERRPSEAILVFRFENPDKALEVLQAAGLTVLSEKEVTSL